MECRNLYEEVKKSLSTPIEEHAYHSFRIKNLYTLLKRNSSQIELRFSSPKAYNLFKKDMRILAHRELIRKEVMKDDSLFYPKWRIIKYEGDPQDYLPVTCKISPPYSTQEGGKNNSLHDIPHIYYGIEVLKSLNIYASSGGIPRWSVVHELYIHNEIDVHKTIFFIDHKAAKIPLTHLKLTFLNYNPPENIVTPILFNVSEKDNITTITINMLEEDGVTFPRSILEYVSYHLSLKGRWKAKKRRKEIEKIYKPIVLNSSIYNNI